MNKQRKNDIDNLIRKLNTISDELSNILDDEQSYYDNMPENLLGSERGLNSESAIEILEEVTESLNNAIENLGEI